MTFESGSDYTIKLETEYEVKMLLHTISMVYHQLRDKSEYNYFDEEVMREVVLPLHNQLHNELKRAKEAVSRNGS